MNIFSAIIGKLQREVTDDKEVLRDCDFPFIHRTFDSDNGCFIVQHLIVIQTVV